MSSDPDVVLTTPDGAMVACTTRPTTPPPWPGVVVVHDFTGLSHDLRAQTDWLAAEGFLAIGPDLYHGRSRMRCLRSVMRDLGRRQGASFDDIDTARQWLVDDPDCTGVVGWLAGACPVVGRFGGADRTPLGAGAGRRLGALLTELEVPHDVKVYAGVGHGFMNDHDPSDLSLMIRFLSWTSGTRYDAEATRDARQRIVTFFDTHLRPSG
jgi:carboxymethylenebutenolidase